MTAIKLRSFGYAIRTGINAILLKGNFVKERNYYEDFVDFYKWW